MTTSEQRRRQLAREKYDRQMARRAEAQQAARKRKAIISGALAVVVIATGGAWAGGVFDSKKSSTPQAAPTPKAVKGCTTPAPGQPNGKKWDAEPAMSIDAKAQYTMQLDTSCGKITIALDAAKAPHTVNSFTFLAGQQFFDHTKCHRITTDGLYVLQCGDPTATGAPGSGGSGGPGYSFKDENLDGAKYPAGTVAMANSGPNTNGSQFFLNYKDSPLPPNYTPFGTITGGMDVLQNIAAAGAQGGAPDGAPVANVVLNSVTVAKN